MTFTGRWVTMPRRIAAILGFAAVNPLAGAPGASKGTSASPIRGSKTGRWKRLGWIGCTMASLGSALPGCTSFFTRKTIEQFTVGLETQDLKVLKEHSSRTFERKALRLPESAKDLKVLRLPTGKVSVVSEEKLDEQHKKVTVEVGEKDRTQQVVYILKREDQFGPWVVDDLDIAQQVSEGETVSRKVTEQMDLLLTCREFLGTWRDGSRERQLEFCSDDLRQELAQLPEPWQLELTQRISGNGHDRSFRPEARMNGDRAGLALDHPDGSLILDYRQNAEGKWHVHDAALEPMSKEKTDTGIRSVKKMASTLNRTARFLRAYEDGESDVLKETASEDFYTHCLESADLQSIPLPVNELLNANYQVRQFQDRTEILFELDRGTYMITLSAPLETKGTELTRGGEQRIQEVTEFTHDNQAKRLSALFLAHEIVTTYNEALTAPAGQRKLDQLRHLSSLDFNRRVWEHPAANLLNIVPLPAVESTAGGTTIVSTEFRGDVTEVTVTRGKNALTYFLVQRGSWLAVDDVLVSAYARPASLKANLELLLPVYAFASASHTRQLDGIIDTASENFNQMVWKQIGSVPPISRELAEAIMFPISSVQPGDPWSVVRTGDSDKGAEVRLVREGHRYVVDSLTLVNGPGAQNQVDVMKTLRLEIAQRTLAPRSSGASGNVMQANHVEMGEQRAVQPAGFEVFDTLSSEGR